MTLDEEKKLIITAISSRSENALAECAKSENSAQLSDVLCSFIWDSLNLLDLLGNETASNTTKKLEAELQNKKSRA